MKKLSFLLFSFIIAINLFSQDHSNEVKIGSWNGESFSYDYDLDLIRADLELAIADSLGIEGKLDSMVISDPEPSNEESIPYLVYQLEVGDEFVTFGHRIIRRQNDNQFEYYLNIDEIDAIEETELAARSWKCKSVDNCKKCKPERSGFLGPVIGCPCIDTDCDFETGGSGFPWGPVLGFVGVLLALIVK